MNDASRPIDHPFTLSLGFVRIPCTTCSASVSFTDRSVIGETLRRAGWTWNGAKRNSQRCGTCSGTEVNA